MILVVTRLLTLPETTSAGVAYHHAGLGSDDRHQIERAFINGELSVISCTSTLAVGVNLPCYLVIIKNTVSWTDRGMQEYPDLEMMQMLGRAGRPQFESSAVAVILTRNERTDHYTKMMSGQERLESCLHLNLIDHLNAEIGLGTISDLASAKRWLQSTFLYVRLQRNPNHYRLEKGSSATDEDTQIQEICSKNIKLLQEHNLVTGDEIFKSTGYGESMARYYVKFETMLTFMSMPRKAKMSEIVCISAVS